MACLGPEERWRPPEAWLCFHTWPGTHIHSWMKPSPEGKCSKTLWMLPHLGQGNSVRDQTACCSTCPDSILSVGARNPLKGEYLQPADLKYFCMSVEAAKTFRSAQPRRLKGLRWPGDLIPQGRRETHGQGKMFQEIPATRMNNIKRSPSSINLLH